MMVYTSFLLTLQLFVYCILSSLAKFKKATLFEFVILSLSVAFYILGMTRIDGVDFSNYQDFIKFPEQVHDFGYRYVCYIANYLSLDFNNLLILQAIITIIAVFWYSKYMNSSATITFAVFVLHSAVVRDFSQSRVGLAVALLFLGYSQTFKIKRLICFLLAISIHYTVILPILSFNIIDRISKFRKTNIIIIFVFFLLFLLLIRDNFISVISIIDPRVDIYLNYHEDLYGNEISSFGIVFQNSVLILISSLAYSATNDFFYKRFLLYSVFGIIIFFALSSVSIFAFRLSHLLTIFYPFIFGKIYFDITAARRICVPGKNILLLKYSFLVMSFFIVTIGLRPGNDAILNYIVPYIEF